MIINLKEKGEVILFAEDPSKPEEHIFVYKLKNLDSALSEDDGADIYVKFEALDVGGSIKTRTAYLMLKAAEEDGSDKEA